MSMLQQAHMINQIVFNENLKCWKCSPVNVINRYFHSLFLRLIFRNLNCFEGNVAHWCASATGLGMRCCTKRAPVLCTYTHEAIFQFFILPDATMNVERNRIVALSGRWKRKKKREKESAHFQCVCWFYFYHLFALTTAHNKYINVCVIFAFASNNIRSNDFVVWSQNMCYCKKRDKILLKRATTRTVKKEKIYMKWFLCDH